MTSFQIEFRETRLLLLQLPNDLNCILERDLKPFQRLTPFTTKRFGAGAIAGTQLSEGHTSALYL